MYKDKKLIENFISAVEMSFKHFQHANYLDSLGGKKEKN